MKAALSEREPRDPKVAPLYWLDHGNEVFQMIRLGDGLLSITPARLHNTLRKAWAKLAVEHRSLTSKRNVRILFLLGQRSRLPNVLKEHLRMSSRV